MSPLRGCVTSISSPSMISSTSVEVDGVGQVFVEDTGRNDPDRVEVVLPHEIEVPGGGDVEIRVAELDLPSSRLTKPPRRHVLEVRPRQAAGDGCAELRIVTSLVDKVELGQPLGVVFVAGDGCKEPVSLLVERYWYAR